MRYQLHDALCNFPPHPRFDIFTARQHHQSSFDVLHHCNAILLVLLLVTWKGAKGTTVAVIMSDQHSMPVPIRALQEDVQCVRNTVVRHRQQRGRLLVVFLNYPSTTPFRNLKKLIVGNVTGAHPLIMSTFPPLKMRS